MSAGFQERGLKFGKRLVLSMMVIGKTAKDVDLVP